MRLTRTPTHPRTPHRPTARRPARRLARGPALGRRATAGRSRLTPCAGPRPLAGQTATVAGPDRAGGRGWRVRRRVLLLAELVGLGLLASGSVAHADTMVLALAGSVDQVLSNIRNWLMGILAGLATVFFTLGGVRRLFCGGDPSEQEKAKEAFKAAGFGYALAALAPLIVVVLKGIVGA